MSTLEAPRTMTEKVLDKLRNDLLRGRFKPGARLTLDSLKQVYNVGYSPLREALMRLAGDGLVVRIGHKGFSVAPVSREDLIRAVGARRDLETIVLRDAIEHGDAAWEARIVSSFHVLSRTPHLEEPDDPSQGWSARHKAFHYALVAAAQNTILKEFWQITFDLTDRYRRIAGWSPRDADAEHKAIMEATIERDADRACRLCGKHVENTLDVLVSLAEAQPVTSN